MGLGWHRGFESDTWSRTLPEDVTFRKYLEEAGQGATWERGLGDAPPGEHSQCKGPGVGTCLDCPVSCKESMWLRVARGAGRGSESC